MEHQQWSHDVICTKTGDNDNILRPIVRIIFKQHNIPTNNIITSEVSTPYFYQDESGYTLSHHDVFHNTVYIDKHSSYGHILNATDLQERQQEPTSEQPTSYICTTRNINPNTTTISSHISTIINNPTTDGIYQLQFSNEMQNDGGANRSVTNYKNILIHYKSIEPYPINGINSNEPAIHCIGFGYIPWKSLTYNTLLIPCYCCPQATGTIISPTDIVFSHLDKRMANDHKH